MNQIRAKFILQGIAICVTGAFLWEIYYFQRIYDGRDRLIVILFSALFGLLMSSIYLVPLGAVIGIALPPIAFKRRIDLCLIAGFLAGVLTAGSSSLLVALAFELRLRATFLSMWPICTAALIGWMFLLRRSR